MKFALAVFLFASGLAAQDALPELTIPGKTGKGNAAPTLVGGDSRAMASSLLPKIINAMGALRNDLVAYFALDTAEAGGLSWSRKPIVVHATSTVVAKEQDGRHYLDFREKAAKLIFDPPLVIGPRFTLMAWLEFPMPDRGCTAWNAEHGFYLFFRKHDILSWNAVERKDVLWAQSKSEITGWHHLAIVSDERRAQAFLDGNPLAVIKPFPSTKLTSFGNGNGDAPGDGIGGADEQFIFSRPLTPEEIAKVMNLTKPLTQK